MEMRNQIKHKYLKNLQEIVLSTPTCGDYSKTLSITKNIFYEQESSL